jgi:hypothetical protein
MGVRATHPAAVRKGGDIASKAAQINQDAQYMLLTRMALEFL